MNIVVNKKSVFYFIVAALYFLFPVVSVLFKSAGSVVFVLIFLLSLFMSRPILKEFAKQEKICFLAYVLLFVYVLMSALSSDMQREGVSHLEHYIRLMSMVLFVSLLLRLKLELVPIFIWGLVLSALAMCFYSVYEVYFLANSIASGPYYRIAVSAFGVLTAFILSLAIILLPSSKWQKVAYAVAVMMSLYTSYLSGGRGAWMAVPVFLCLLFFYFRHKIKLRQVLLLLLTVGLLLTAAFALQPMNIVKGINNIQSDLQLFREDPSHQSSFGDRLNLWRNSLLIWQSSPVFGTGIGDFRHDNQAFIKQGISLNNELNYNHAHNIYFDALATMGLVGLILFLWALFVMPLKLFMSYWQQGQDPWLNFCALSGVVTLTSFAVFGLTEGVFSRNLFANAYVIYLSAFLASYLIRKKKLNSALLD